MSKNKRALNLTLLPDIIEWLDLIVEQRHYSSRSVLVEELIRERYDQLRKAGMLVDDLPAGEFTKMVQRAKEIAKEGNPDSGKLSSSRYPSHKQELNEARETPAGGTAAGKKKRAA